MKTKSQPDSDAATQRAIVAYFLLEKAKELLRPIAQPRKPRGKNQPGRYPAM